MTTLQVLQALLLAGLMALFAVPEPVSAQPRHKWWEAGGFKAELDLTDDQSARIEEIFQETLPDLRDGNQRLDRLEAELSRLVSRSDAGENEVRAQIELVEDTRAELAKTRTFMLFRMHQVLSETQRERLRALHDRERRRLRDEGHR